MFKMPALIFAEKRQTVCAVRVPRIIKQIAGFKRLPLFSKEIHGVPLLRSKGINKRLMGKPHWRVGSFDLRISQISCFGTRVRASSNRGKWD